MNGGELTELDWRIIELLQTDGRRTNTELARELDVSEGTVRYRIHRLIEGGYMSVVAMTRLHKLGFTIDVFLTIDVRPGTQSKVAEELSRLRCTRYVAVTSGQCDIVCGAIFKTNSELMRFLSEDLGRIEGVTRVQSVHVLKAVKRTHDWLPYEMAPVRPGET